MYCFYSDLIKSNTLGLAAGPLEVTEHLLDDKLLSMIVSSSEIVSELIQ